MGFFLGAHEVGFAVIVIPAAGFLTEHMSGIQFFGLPDHFVFHGPVGGTETVQVFDFDLGAEFLLAHGAQGDIHVAAHLALFHIAIADAAVTHDFFQAGQISIGFISTPHIRFADDFQQRHARTVIVCTGKLAEMGQFGRVFFQMDASDADGLFRQIVSGKTFAAADIQMAFRAERHIILGDLVILGKVGIKVTLTVKFAHFGNFAPGQQSGFHRLENRFFIRHRQRPGITQANRTGQCIGLRTETVGAGTEHLALGTDLNMDFQADHGFILHISLQSWFFFSSV